MLLQCFRTAAGPVMVVVSFIRWSSFVCALLDSFQRVGYVVILTSVLLEVTTALSNDVRIILADFAVNAQTGLFTKMEHVSQ